MVYSISFARAAGRPFTIDIGGGGGSSNSKVILDEELTRYPTDFLRDVVPIPCHSHNDYWRAEPLFAALRAGCQGVEADVWFLPEHYAEYGLLVGHDTASLAPRRSFASLYVEPLVELLLAANPRTPFHHGASQHGDANPDGDGDGAQKGQDWGEPPHFGVFDADPTQSLVLLVDVKTGGAETWPRVLEQLEPLRSRGWLTHVVRTDESDGGGLELRPRPITVVATGNAPFDLVAANASYRDAFFDAPLEALFQEDEDSAEAGQKAKAKKEGGDLPYDATNSFYASTSLRAALGTSFFPLGGTGLSDDQRRAVRAQIRGAHARGLKARYWDTPSWPIALRNGVWRALLEEGADILNVDDLHAASRGVW